MDLLERIDRLDKQMTIAAMYFFCPGMENKGIEYVQQVMLDMKNIPIYSKKGELTGNASSEWFLKKFIESGENLKMALQGAVKKLRNPVFAHTAIDFENIFSEVIPYMSQSA